MADELYEEKIMDMQKHIPFVEKFVQKLKNGNDAERSVYLQKMETLYDILTNKDKKSSLETLQKCEVAILKLHGKIEKKTTSPAAEDVIAAQGSSNFKSPLEDQNHIVTPAEHIQDPSHSPRFPIVSKVGDRRSSTKVEILNPSNSNFVPNLQSSPDLNFSLNSPTNKLTTKLTPQESVKTNDAMIKELKEQDLKENQFEEIKLNSEVDSDQIKEVVITNFVENSHNTPKDLNQIQMSTSGGNFEPRQTNEKLDISIFVKEEQSIEKNKDDPTKVLTKKEENSRKTESQAIPPKAVKHSLDMTEKSSEKLMTCSTKEKEIEKPSARITKEFMNSIFEINKSNKRKNESKLDKVPEKIAKVKNENTRSKKIKVNNVRKVKDSVTTEMVSEEADSASSETKEKQERDNDRDAHSSPSPLNMTRRSTFDDSQDTHVQVSSSSASIEKGKIKDAADNNSLESSKDESVTKEWLNGFLLNLVNPEHINKTTVLEILEKVLDEEKFQQIKTIVNDEAEPQFLDHKPKEVKARRKNELDRLKEDIQDININEGISTAKGRRLCMSNNAKQGEVKTVSEITSNSSKSVPTSSKSNSACKIKSMVTRKGQTLNETPAKRQRNTAQRAAANIALLRDGSSEKIVVNGEKEQDGVEDVTAMNTILAPRKRKAAQIAAAQISLQSCDYNEHTRVSSDNEENCNAILALAKRKATQIAENLRAHQPTSKEVGERTIRKSMRAPNSEGKTTKNKLQAIAKDLSSDSLNESSVPLNSKNNGTKEEGTFKNIHPEMHVLSNYAITCQLCTFGGKDQVNHYLDNHEEVGVVISRLPPASQQRIVANESNTPSYYSKRTRLFYHYACPFCDVEHSFQIKEWIRHFNSHTGERPFQCSKCKYKFSGTSKHIRMKCPTARSIRILPRREGGGPIVAFICKLCNYIQLNRKNVVDHLITQHDCSEERIIEVSLLIPRPKNSTDLPQSDENQKKMKSRKSGQLTRETQPAGGFNNTGKVKECRSRRLSEDLKLDVKDRERTLKNIHPEMHSQSEYATKCVLCPFSGQYLTKHYLRNHPKMGVLISRLPPEAQKHIFANEVELAYEYADKSLRFFRYACPFCNVEYSYTRPIWIDHLSTHTGEYSFKCSECNAVQNTLTKMKAHMTNHGPQAYAMRLRKHNFRLGPILGFVCNLCNFIQLNRNNVVDHLISQHECSEEEISKITLLNAGTNNSRGLLKFDGNRTEIGKAESQKRQTVNEIQTRQRKAAQKTAGKKKLQSADYREKQKDKIQHFLETETPTTSQPSIKRNKELYKNIHPEMHTESKYSKECVLCSFVGYRLSNHYVLFHPDSEVLISRLRPEVHKQIVANEGNLVILPVHNSPIRYACPFCSVVYFTKRPDWVLHFETHTGEYRFKCSGCNYKQSRVQILMKHMKQQCPNANLIRLPKSCTEEGKISAFICNVCNFIQLNRVNIVNHLITQHDISEERISKVILLRYETKTKNCKPVKNALITRKLKVKIKRMHRTTINKFTRVLKSIENSEENYVPLKDQASSGRKINLVVGGTEGILKNIHPEMHYKSEYATKCALCPFMGQNLSQHYFYSHPKVGVLISRLPPERQELIIANKENLPLRIIVDNSDGHSYRYDCPFCEVEYSYTRQDWVGHFGTHTGEYAFKCSKCNIMRGNLTEMKRHLKNQCPKAHPIPLRELDVETGSIFAFICNLCNFIQLSQSNIADHMTTQHDCSAEDVIKVRLLSLKAGKSGDRRKSTNLDILESGAQSRLDDTKKEMPVGDNRTESKSASLKFSNSTEETTKSKITLAEETNLTGNNSTEATVLKTNDADLEGNQISPGYENNGDDSDRIESVNGKIMPQISASNDQGVQDTSLQTTTNQTLDCKKPNSKTIYRINNLAYSKMPENVIRYHCLVKPCSFAYTDISVGLEYHISCEHATIFWDGYCRRCYGYVALNSGMTLMRELEHMQEVHINHINLDEGELSDKDESMQGLLVEGNNGALSAALPLRALPNPILLDQGITITKE